MKQPPIQQDPPSSASAAVDLATGARGGAAALRARLLLLARTLPRDLAISTAIVVLIALFITLVLRTGHSYLINLTFSMSIGTLALLIIDSGRLLIWGERQPARLPFILLVLAAIPVAQHLGNRLAAWLLDLPPDAVGQDLSANATEYLVLTVFASLGITWFFWNRGRLSKLKADAETEKARAAAVEKQATQAQLQLLQAQIEPHMLFNTLANLQGLIAIDPPRAQQLLDQLILYLRATLSSARAGSTTLAHEFALMEAYLGLMSVRMGERLGYALELPPALANAAIAPMLLQPLVENAVKHGLEPKIDGGRIEVRAECRDGLLVLCVTDTGLGLHAGASAGAGVGLANVRERLLALYGSAASFTLAPNHPAGCVSRIAIPISVPEAE